jgi:AcrR family transcriptional regulator
MLANPVEIEKVDPRVKRTRVLIEGTFLRLLEEKGFHAITVQDITQQAEINRATFYAHYPDKFALFDTMLRANFRREVEKRTLNACHYSPSNALALFVTVCEFVAKADSGCKDTDAQFDALVEGQVRGQIQELFEKWIGQVPGLEPDQVLSRATAATWAVYGLAQKWKNDKGAGKLGAEAYGKQVLPLVSSLLE